LSTGKKLGTVKKLFYNQNKNFSPPHRETTMQNSLDKTPISCRVWYETMVKQLPESIFLPAVVKARKMLA
jgi:hypothetical protein